MVVGYQCALERGLGLSFSPPPPPPSLLEGRRSSHVTRPAASPPTQASQMVALRFCPTAPHAAASIPCVRRSTPLAPSPASRALPTRAIGSITRYDYLLVPVFTYAYSGDWFDYQVRIRMHTPKTLHSLRASIVMRS